MTFVASWLQNDGTSQLVCSKISSPFSPLIWALRTSQSTVEKRSSISAGQNWASTLSRPWNFLAVGFVALETDEVMERRSTVAIAAPPAQYKGASYLSEHLCTRFRDRPISGRGTRFWASYAQNPKKRAASRVETTIYCTECPSRYNMMRFREFDLTLGTGYVNAIP